VGTRRFLRPLWGGSFMQDSDALRRENVDLHLAVIASAAKQSILSYGRDGCFAEPVIGRRFAPTRWLAMTELAV